MTTTTVTGGSGADMNYFQLPEITTKAVTGAWATSIEWSPVYATITLTGTDLQPVLTNNRLSDLNGGTVTGLSYVSTDPNEPITVSFTNMALSAVDFFDLAAAPNWLGLRALILGGNDQIYGSAASDFLVGIAGSDRLFGNAGNDTIVGGSGADVLSGGRGNDKLIGGAGADKFVFGLSPALGGVDAITDFVAGVDKISLNGAAFGNIGASGSLLDAAHFHLGLTATTGQQGILYDKATGTIYSDADGLGGAAAVQFAIVTAGLTLSASDFLVF